MVFLDVLLKPEIKNSVWNTTESYKTYVSSAIAENPTATFSKEQFEFYDYCKTVMGFETTDSPRFLNNIYSSIFHYILDVQHNAAVNI